MESTLLERWRVHQPNVSLRVQHSRPENSAVAARAGVSITTVSRALRQSGPVASGTRARVLAAVEELRFTPSRLGRALAERRHAANGIVFPDLSGPYFAEVVLGYEEVAAELGRSVLILSTHGREAVRDMVFDLASRVDGLVIFSRTVGDDVVHEIAAGGLPVVLLARPPRPGLTTVRQPMHELGARAALALDERITGARSAPRHDLLPTELVVRASCGHHR